MKSFIRHGWAFVTASSMSLVASSSFGAGIAKPEKIDPNTAPGAIHTTFEEAAQGVASSHHPVQLITQVTLSIVVPRSKTGVESIRRFTDSHGIKSRSKLSGSSWEMGLEEDDVDELDTDSNYDDSDVSDDNINILEFEVPETQIKTFEKFIDSISLPSFGIHRSSKKIQRQVPGNYRGKRLPIINGNYIIEVRQVDFSKASLSTSFSLVNIDHRLFSGGAIGIHASDAAPGLSVGILRGSEHRDIIYADITNYLRMTRMSAFKNQVSPVVGYDLGIMSIDHQSFCMAGINAGPSFTDYRSYSVSLLARFLALVSQNNAKFVVLPALEFRIFL